MADISLLRLRRAAVIAPFALFLLVYGASVGRGFVADDFAWILQSRVQSIADLPALFLKSGGFYRPVVGLTFAANYALFGSNPLGYGLTNLALAFLCAGLLYLVAREWPLPRDAALFVVALWLLNPHGINTAILWTSGRTSLLLTFGALAAALLVLRNRPFMALLPAGLALFSKEEAFVLPANLFAWWITTPAEKTRRQIVVWIAAALSLLGVYLLLRFQTSAMTPWTAPPYYRFTAHPATLARNVREYADRAMTFSAAATLLAWLILRPARSEYRNRTQWVRAAAWVVGGYGLTVFLPVRSSLYACFPSIGACLLAGDQVSRWWTSAPLRSRRLIPAAAVVVVVGLSPIYVMRNRTTVANARFSSTVLHELDTATSEVPDDQTVIVTDDRKTRPNVETAFNMALDEAFELGTGRRLHFWVEPPLQHADLAGLVRPCAGCARVVLRVRNGHVGH